MVNNVFKQISLDPIEIIRDPANNAPGTTPVAVITSDLTIEKVPAGDVEARQLRLAGLISVTQDGELKIIHKNGIVEVPSDGLSRFKVLQSRSIFGVFLLKLQDLNNVDAIRICWPCGGGWCCTDI